MGATTARKPVTSSKGRTRTGAESAQGVVPSRSWAEHYAAGIRVQCCGDAHLCNFGGFATPERKIIFSINDIDKAVRKGTAQAVFEEER